MARIAGINIPTNKIKLNTKFFKLPRDTFRFIKHKNMLQV